MNPSVFRVVLAYKRRMVRKLKKRSPSKRFKARLYYRKHKAKIKLQRSRYSKKYKSLMKSRKMFKRTKPAWYSKKKKYTPKKIRRPHKLPKPKKPRIPKKHVISKPKRKKFHVPKRRNKG